MQKLVNSFLAIIIFHASTSQAQKSPNEITNPCISTQSLPYVEAKDFNTLDPSEINKLILQVKSRITLPFPSILQIRELPANSLTSGSLTYGCNRIDMKLGPSIYELFVHELGHAIVQTNLANNIPEYDLYNHDISRPDLPQFSAYFQEVFSDLLAATVYSKPNVMDFLNPGFRNFEVDTFGKEPPIFFDSHLLFQPLGQYIYRTYLKGKQENEKLVFYSFYKLIEAEVHDAISSSYIVNANPFVKKTPDGIVINGRLVNNYLNELQIKFDKIFQLASSNTLLK